jgi:hypothetical protein
VTAVLGTVGWTPDLAVGIRVGALLGGALLGGWFAIGLTIAIATATPARAIPGAALLVASQARRRTILAGACLLASVLLPLAGVEPSFAMLASGFGFLTAIRLGWPAVERLAGGAGDLP